jgi:hypothetical protein
MRTQIKIPRTTLLIGLLLAGMLIISACSSQENSALTQEELAPAEQSSEQLVEASPPESPEELIPTATAGEAPTITADDPPGGYPAPGYPAPIPTSDFVPYPSPEEAAAPPPPKTGLEATHPSTVVLAAGKPQLIEFFAFW